MDYIEQMLEDLGEGSRIVVEHNTDDDGHQFTACFMDAMNKGFFEVVRPTIDLAIGELDRQAEEWLVESSDD